MTCLITDNILNCLKCESNSYALLHGEKTECKEKISMETNDNYYKNDDRLNYYSCRDIRCNSVVNCNTCNDKDTCKSFISGYTLVN